MNDGTINIQIKSLPDSPGVYQFFDKDNKYLYVGKAKNIKKRVNSYFQKTPTSNKLRILVRKIVSVKHIVVQSESDALLLENNLIKTHQPRYNVLLKDDKSFPWICIKKERFPRIFYTRRFIKDGSEYYGPYTNVRMVITLLEMIKQIYPLRNCKYDLSEKNIRNKKYKLCLEYHLKNCKGPCEGVQDETSYGRGIESARSIIKGDIKDCLKQLYEEMRQASKILDFEKAHLVKEKIKALELYQSKSTVVTPRISNVDVFSIISDERFAYVNFIQINKGSVIRAHSMEIKKKLDESNQKLLELAIINIQQQFQSNPKEIIVPISISILHNMKVTIPKTGEKRKLLDLSLRNAQFYKKDRLKQLKILDPDRHINRIMSQMQSDLKLFEEPRYIECFDNSNIHGSNPVAACVVFKNGNPSKKEYRHFNIKTVNGIDDFKSMEEVIYRRYKRLLDGGESLPQLIVIDGGKGQLSSALKSLIQLGLQDKIAIIGIAKRLEEIFFTNDSIPLYLDKTSETLKIIQQLRNEAHRFGLKFHRNKRSQKALKSELEHIKNIGPQTAVKLLKHFKSVKRVKEANLYLLSSVIGKQKAKNIINYFEKAT